MIIIDEQNTLLKRLSSDEFSLKDFFSDLVPLSMMRFCSQELKKRNELVLVDVQSVLKHPELFEKFRIVLNTFLGAICFYENSSNEAIEWLNQEVAISPKLIASFSLPLLNRDKTFLINQIQFFSNLIEEQKNLQKHMTKFSIELDQVLAEAHMDMLKVKKMHGSMIPKRNQEIKGINFSTKYAVGDSGGAEFFDLIQTPKKVFLILISSQSYLGSNAIMGILSSMKNDDFIPEEFIQAADKEMEMINSSKKKKSICDLTVLEIDLLSLDMRVCTSRNSDCFSLKCDRVELKPDFHYHIEKGEKLIIFSPGFKFNWQENCSEKDLFSFIKSNNNLNMNELMSELFFSLKDGLDSEFLQRDATVIMMEVNRHAIYKI